MYDVKHAKKIITSNLKLFYSETCNYKPQFLDMVNLIEKNIPTAKVSGTEGKEGKITFMIL
ncbi:migration and invasion enhancer 1 [Vespula squamosa]|uniref:Migration and invasion enhancer 1 n=1 Tax=Vespula squamosa TaxID=30214 RepID=A0ABD2AI48_VESSQ